MIKHIQDRLVVMQIETQSQPFNKNQNQSGSMLEQSNTKNSNGSKKCYSPNSNDCEIMENLSKPYPYIQKRIRRHCAKRPKKVYEYDLLPKRRTDKLLKRNKRLRQTYFASNIKNIDQKSYNGNKKRAKYVETTLDMYFPAQTSDDAEMHADAE